MYNIILQFPNHPIFSIIAFEIFLIALFAVPRHQHRNKVVLCLLCIIATASIGAAPLTDKSDYAQLWSFAWVPWLATFTKFIATTVPPETKYWRHANGIREAENLRSSDLRKIAWSASLVHNMRGIGWNWQVKGTPPQKDPGRLNFVLKNMVQITMLAFATGFLHHSMLRLYPSMTSNSPPKYLTIRHPGWFHDGANKFLFGISAFLSLQLHYVALSTVAVTCGWSIPQDWPPMFGNLGDSFTVRRFWGRSWHQLIRSSFATCSSAVIESWQITRGSMLSSYLQLWMAFGISGLCHAHGILMLPNAAQVSIHERITGTIMFFLWQAAAICVEDVVQHLGGGLLRAQKHQRQRHIIGYVWVLWSFWVSLPWVADDLLRMGLLIQPTMDSSSLNPREALT